MSVVVSVVDDHLDGESFHHQVLHAAENIAVIQHP